MPYLPANPETFQIGQVSLRLARPITLRQQWIGDHEILRQLLACWLVIDEKDSPPVPTHRRPTRCRENHLGNGSHSRAKTGSCTFINVRQIRDRKISWCHRLLQKVERLPIKRHR